MPHRSNADIDNFSNTNRIFLLEKSRRIIDLFCKVEKLLLIYLVPHTHFWERHINAEHWHLVEQYSLVGLVIILLWGLFHFLAGDRVPVGKNILYWSWVEKLSSWHWVQKFNSLKVLTETHPKKRPSEWWGIVT